MEQAIRRVRNEPLNYVSTLLFAIADLFAIVSLSTPNWLKATNDGKMQIGLLSTCHQVKEQDGVNHCYIPDYIQPEWILTFIFIIIGILGLTVAAAANAFSFIKYPYEAQTIARFAGLVTIIFFNLAQIVFPSAFGQDQIGGAAFQLPSNFDIGPSYVLFFMAHWASVISELCAAKICRTRWQF
ncbi:modulator of smoothened protein-like [Watersipora subatra]|uniref:modulator of smoothened protein-like n=1 Tax=Watersipora subatra TaxID=2589382 RepID=UPI00355B34AC